VTRSHRPATLRRYRRSVAHLRRLVTSKPQASNLGAEFSSEQSPVACLATDVVAALLRYWIQRRWGPYVRKRWREGAHKRMKYIAKLPNP
jgi:hypothetical protein